MARFEEPRRDAGARGAALSARAQAMGVEGPARAQVAPSAVESPWTRVARGPPEACIVIRGGVFDCPRLDAEEGMGDDRARRHCDGRRDHRCPEGPPPNPKP